MRTRLDGGSGYELVAGERRLRAVTLLNWATIPALVRNYSDVEVQQITLIENIQRQDLNAIEEAQALQSLLVNLQISQEQLAQKIGKSRTAISNALRLLTLPTFMQEQLSCGKVSVGQVRPLVSLKDTVVQEELWQELITKKLTARQVEKLVKEQKLQKNKTAARKIPLDVHLQQVENQLIASLGTKVKIQGDQNCGKIEINYYSLQNLEELLKKMLDE